MRLLPGTLVETGLPEPESPSQPPPATAIPNANPKTTIRIRLTMAPSRLVEIIATTAAVRPPRFVGPIGPGSDIKGHATKLRPGLSCRLARVQRQHLRCMR